MPRTEGSRSWHTPGNPRTRHLTRGARRRPRTPRCPRRATSLRSRLLMADIDVTKPRVSVRIPRITRALLVGRNETASPSRIVSVARITVAHISAWSGLVIMDVSSFGTCRARGSRLGAALLRRRPKGLLPAARQELLDPSKAWWGGRRGRLADRPRYSISVSLGVVPRWYSRVVEVPVRIEVAAGFVAPGASEPPRLQPSWPPGGSRPAHG